MSSTYLQKLLLCVSYISCAKRKCNIIVLHICNNGSISFVFSDLDWAKCTLILGQEDYYELPARIEEGASNETEMEKEKIAEIPFWVYDRPKWISGITPSTSCEDILRSLASFLQPEDSNRKSAKLILTEKWRDVERPLAYDAKILKIWTAWGDEKKFVKFVVKRVSERSQSHSSSNNHRKRLRRRGSVSSVDELHPKALHVKSKLHDKVRTSYLHTTFMALLILVLRDVHKSFYFHI